MESVIYLNFAISVIFTLCYFYQFVYVFIGLITKPKKFTAKKNHRYAVVISARNEACVIGNLIQSVKEQSYPSELVDVFVVADNCTDNTADAARSAGAIVYERFNKEYVGKGYALDWLFTNIKNDYAHKNFEAYIIFDADNILEHDYIENMNKVFDNGYRIITSYRNSKNYGDNWLTAGYSLWFLREARYLNNARMKLGNSCAVSGTGFLVSADVIEENGGWVHHLLTEDIEFTADSIIKGEKIGYCADAVLYDEQPSSFCVSYKQRLRWAKGFYQVLYHYGWKLFKGIFKGSFSCYDMLMMLSPAMLLTISSVLINIGAIAISAFIAPAYIPMLFEVLAKTVLSFYFMFFALGAVTIITEWNKINCKNSKKILHLFTFPLFLLTYAPIAIIALFKRVKWEPIRHSVTKTIDDIEHEFVRK
ncbi:MAG: glycosyltransferase [Ruminococcaceae bacterium]|nr:glycosyltransferase [Oscillospiraceae bacterium]